jgi:CRISPR-associated protein Csy1
VADALGNAAVLDVYKFLSLIMQDNQTLLQQIDQQTDLAKELLDIKGQDYSVLQEGFLAMTAQSSEAVTSSKIKQVYFPLDNSESPDYHQLSILTNSGLVFEMRKRLGAMRFGVDADIPAGRYLTKDGLKQARDKRRNNDFFAKPFDEIYGLSTIGYGDEALGSGAPKAFLGKLCYVANLRYTKFEL